VYIGTLLLLYPLRFLVLSMRATSTLVIVVAIILYMAFPATEAAATRMEID
jgi:membrane-anchored protein YejM (alkaline phosphatase superfamily)